MNMSQKLLPLVKINRSFDNFYDTTKAEINWLPIRNSNGVIVRMLLLFLIEIEKYERKEWTGMTVARVMNEVSNMHKLPILMQFYLFIFDLFLLKTIFKTTQLS